METYSFYLQTSQIKELVTLLQSLTGTAVFKQEAPAEINTDRPCPRNFVPDILFISQNINGWLEVDHNAPRPLPEWGILLSKELSTRFVQVYADKVKQHLLVYKDGQCEREIKVNRSKGSPIKDIGKKFDFEMPYIHLPGAYKNEADFENEELLAQCGIFSYETMKGYYEFFGFDPSDVDIDARCYTLRKATVSSLLYVCK